MWRLADFQGLNCSDSVWWICCFSLTDWFSQPMEQTLRDFVYYIKLVHFLKEKPPQCLKLTQSILHLYRILYYCAGVSEENMWLGSPRFSKQHMYTGKLLREWSQFWREQWMYKLCALVCIKLITSNNNVNIVITFVNSNSADIFVISTFT